jgi:DNA-binding SARP family transcriptional activator
MTLGGPIRQVETAAANAWLGLTGEFQLVLSGHIVPVPHSVERVLAYLALCDRPVSRAKLAGILWIDSSDRRAANSLRTALWRLHDVAGRVVRPAEDRLALASDVRVDLAELVRLTRRIIDEPGGEALVDLPLLVDHAELLPDWDEEWIVADRERFRLLRLEALENAAERLLERGELGRALDAALAATEAEPLRESARRIQMRVQLAEGNAAQALRIFEDYRTLLTDEVGLAPSEAMRTLVGRLDLNSRRRDATLTAR